MRSFRFTIGALMGLVALVAVGFAALRSSSPIWASAIFTATIFLLLAGVVGAFAHRGPSRPVWLGFATFGSAYLLGAFWLWPGPNGVKAPPLLSKFLIDALEPGTVGTSVLTIDPGPVGESSTETPQMYYPPPKSGNFVVAAPFPGRVVNLLHFRRIGHSLTAILFGIAGALLGRFLASGGTGAVPGPRAS